MLDRFKTLPSPALVIAFIALLVALGGGAAVALPGKNGVTADDIRKNAVGASEIKSNAVRSAEIRRNAVGSTEVRNNSLTGDDINEATLNIGGGGGGGSTGPALVSFSATLSANQTKTETIGNFTITSATNAAGQCGPILLQAGNLDSQRSVGLNAAFANLGANATATITNVNVSQAFTGVSDNGASAVSGVVGRAQQGATCLLTGYMTGN
jgi:hypothetical protein